jgi:hypothetical protein
MKHYVMTTGAAFGLLALAHLAHAQDVTVLAANYDLEFSIDDQLHKVRSRALVRSGNEIPILLQNFKIGLRVSERSTDEFLVQVVGYEKDGPTWHQITVPPPEFGGKLGIPAEYVWESGGIKLDLAIVIGIHEL